MRRNLTFTEQSST
jgi:phosphoenolpyruvate carboxykinase (ATP)